MQIQLSFSAFIFMFSSCQVFMAVRVDNVERVARKVKWWQKQGERFLTSLFDTFNWYFALILD